MGAQRDYLDEARGILDGFFGGSAVDVRAMQESLHALILAKHRARREGGLGFEKLLLDCVRKYDEQFRDGQNDVISEKLNILASYLERYEHVQSSLGRVALADVDYSDEWFNKFLESKRAFDALKEGLFEELFIEEWLEIKHITGHGREKIKAVAKFMDDILAGKTSAKAAAKRMKKLAEVEWHPFKSSYL